MDLEYIKASDYAKLTGQNYRTILRHYKAGYIEGFTNEYGRTYLKNPKFKESISNDTNKNKVILYARVSSSTNKGSLDGQIERMRNYASAKGYDIVGEYKEIASGLNDDRKILNQILNQNDYSILLVEHKDRLTRFGFNYINLLLNKMGVKVEFINHTENKNQEIIDDFVSIITSFCGKIYGAKRKEKTNKIIKEIQDENKLEII